MDGAKKEGSKETTPSTVWIGTSTHSCSKITVLDANSPSTALDQFIVCSSHLLCMTAVPGVRENDFDLEDGFEGNSTAKQPRKSIEKLQRNRPPIGPRSYSYGSGSEMRPTPPGRKASSQEIPSSDQSGIRTMLVCDNIKFVSPFK